MKPVTQTKFGDPEGNCLMACVASIVEVPIDECPPLVTNDDPEGHGWWTTRCSMTAAAKRTGREDSSLLEVGRAPSGSTVSHVPSFVRSCARWTRREEDEAE